MELDGSCVVLSAEGAGLVDRQHMRASLGYLPLRSQPLRLTENYDSCRVLMGEVAARVVRRNLTPYMRCWLRLLVLLTDANDSCMGLKAVLEGLPGRLMLM